MGLEDAGIVRLRNGHLAWGGKDSRTGHGFGAFRWAPRWFRRAVIVAWNRVACRLFGRHRGVAGDVCRECGRPA